MSMQHVTENDFRIFRHNMLTVDEICIPKYQREGVVPVNLGAVFKSSAASHCHQLTTLWTIVLLTLLYHLHNVILKY